MVSGYGVAEEAVMGPSHALGRVLAEACAQLGRTTRSVNSTEAVPVCDGAGSDDTRRTTRLAPVGVSSVPDTYYCR